MRYAEKLAVDFRSVDATFKTELREHFTNAEIAELLMMIGQYIALGRLLVISGGNKAVREIYVPDA